MVFFIDLSIFYTDHNIIYIFKLYLINYDHYFLQILINYIMYIYDILILNIFDLFAQLSLELSMKCCIIASVNQPP